MLKKSLSLLVCAILALTSLQTAVFAEADTNGILTDDEIKALMPGYDAVDQLDKMLVNASDQNDYAARRTALLNEYAGYGFAYESFEGYKTYGNIGSGGVNFGMTFNGGAGWAKNGNVEIKSGYITDPNRVWDANAAGGKCFWPQNSGAFSRTLVNGIDFSKDGEYFVALDVHPKQYSASQELDFIIGEAVSFGFVLTNTSSFTVNMKALSDNSTVSEAVTDMAQKKWSTLLLHIITKESGNDAFELFEYSQGASMPAAPVCTMEKDLSLTEQTVISITNKAGHSAVIDNIKVECYNDTVVKGNAMATAKAALRSAKNEADITAALSAMKESFAKDYLKLIAYDFLYVGAGCDKVLLVDNIEDEALKTKYRTAYNSYGFAYDNFESELEGAKTHAYWNANGYLNLMPGRTLGRGAGWRTDWEFTKASAGSTLNVSDFSSDTSNPVSAAHPKILVMNGATAYREFSNPIDLGKDGEYFVKVTAAVVPAYATPDSIFKIRLGDNIIFGVQVKDTITAGNSAKPYVPYLTTNGTIDAEAADRNERYEIRGAKSYQDYLLHIVSKSDINEDDTITLYVNEEGSLAEAMPMVTKTIKSDDSLNKITFESADKEYRIYQVGIACFNDAVAASPIDLDTVRSTITSTGDKSADLSAVAALPDCAARDWLYRFVNAQNPEITRTQKRFVKKDGTSNVTITDLDYYDASSEDNTFGAVITLQSTYEESKPVEIVMAVYDNDKLVDVTVTSHTLSNFENWTLWEYFDDTTFALPVGMTNPKVKVFVFHGNSMSPIFADVMQIARTDNL